MVLIHGGNLDAGMWDEDVPIAGQDVPRHHLRRPARTAARDRRPPGYAWHEDLRALLDHLKIERADLVGLSLGARLAINFAIAYPSRVDRLVLAGPGLDGWPFTPDPQLAGLVAAAKARDAAKATALWLQHPYMAPAMRDPAVAARAAPASPRRNEHIWLQPMGPAVVPSPPAIDRLREIQRADAGRRRHARRARHPGIADRLDRDIRGARLEGGRRTSGTSSTSKPRIFAHSAGSWVTDCLSKPVRRGAPRRRNDYRLKIASGR